MSKTEITKKAKNWLELKIVDGLGLELRIFNLSQQKSTREAKVDLKGQFNNMSKGHHFDMFFKWSD